MTDWWTVPRWRECTLFSWSGSIPGVPRRSYRIPFVLEIRHQNEFQNNLDPSEGGTALRSCQSAITFYCHWMACREWWESVLDTCGQRLTARELLEEESVTQCGHSEAKYWFRNCSPSVSLFRFSFHEGESGRERRVNSLIEETNK